MTRKDNPLSDGEKLALGGGIAALIAAAAGLVFLATRAKKGVAAPLGDVPPSSQPLPTPGVAIPAEEQGNGAFNALGDPTPAQKRTMIITGDKYRETPAPYVLVLYTAKWLPEDGKWANWSSPQSFRGRVVDSTWNGKPIYSSPDDEFVEWLTALAVTNPMGFWLAYALPITQTDENNVPTRYGAQGPYMTGRFGDLHGLNQDPLQRLAAIVYGTDGLVTQYILTPGFPIPLEKILA